MSKYDKMTRDFILGEGYSPPDVFSYIQSIDEILDNLNVSSLRNERKVKIAKNHIREIRRNIKKIVEENKMLQEKLSILEEEKEV